MRKIKIIKGQNFGIHVEKKIEKENFFLDWLDDINGKTVKNRKTVVLDRRECNGFLFCWDGGAGSPFILYFFILSAGRSGSYPDRCPDSPSSHHLQ